uniref:Mitogen-activated protein kinase kinase kinase 12-like n=1 Tax=Papaver somniferum TaxID=3469 RepID=A0A5B7LL78_PAPSO|nr:mitogen-activated protein kinase kinase kinase 12-like [Papaver somniferum]
MEDPLQKSLLERIDSTYRRLNALQKLMEDPKLKETLSRLRHLVELHPALFGKDPTSSVETLMKSRDALEKTMEEDPKFIECLMELMTQLRKATVDSDLTTVEDTDLEFTGHDIPQFFHAWNRLDSTIRLALTI